MSVEQEMREALVWEQTQREARRTRKSDYRLREPQDEPIVERPAQWKKFKLRYAARCSQCGGPILPGHEAWVKRNKDGTWRRLHIGHKPPATRV